MWTGWAPITHGSKLWRSVDSLNTFQQVSASWEWWSSVRLSSDQGQCAQYLHKTVRKCICLKLGRTVQSSHQNVFSIPKSAWRFTQTHAPATVFWMQCQPHSIFLSDAQIMLHFSPDSSLFVISGECWRSMWRERLFCVSVSSSQRCTGRLGTLC